VYATAGYLQGLEIRNAAGTVLIAAGTVPSAITNSSITLGSDGVLSGAGGGTVTAAGIGAATISSVANKLTNGAANVMSTGFFLQTNGYAGGNGIAMYDGGFIAKKSGANTFVIGSDGSATFSGALTVGIATAQYATASVYSYWYPGAGATAYTGTTPVLQGTDLASGVSFISTTTKVWIFARVRLTMNQDVWSGNFTDTGLMTASLVLDGTQLYTPHAIVFGKSRFYMGYQAQVDTTFVYYATLGSAGNHTLGFKVSYGRQKEDNTENYLAGTAGGLATCYIESNTYILENKV
jgi:hypothetical protein